MALEANPKGFGAVRRFFGHALRWLSPWVRLQVRLGVAYQEAVVRKAQAEADYSAQRAAWLAADAERIRQETAEAFFKNVDAVVGGTGMATLLKAGKLLEESPNLGKWLDPHPGRRNGFLKHSIGSVQGAEHDDHVPTAAVPRLAVTHWPGVCETAPRPPSPTIPQPHAEAAAPSIPRASKLETALERGR